MSKILKSCVKKSWVRDTYLPQECIEVSDLTNLKHITVSEKNYQILRCMGHTSDSMNDVITVVLSKVLQTGDSWTDPQSAKTQVPNGVESNG